ncbi:hypothetical protein ANCDUO_15910 [Ancylostoma duodenale]|uniref:Uncharacterized protein n=1 Tax=Ancylostoma duodenale TaxID=51022 RepID=A0A0C2FZC0_9BILA|nr:hypothetical protein ANCDUO_15910 [Ancylostoma duodenale]
MAVIAAGDSENAEKSKQRTEQMIRSSGAYHQKLSDYETRQHKVILLLVNAFPHVIKAVEETLGALRWDGLPHAAYSTDCAPLD